MEVSKDCEIQQKWIFPIGLTALVIVCYGPIFNRWLPRRYIIIHAAGEYLQHESKVKTYSTVR